MKHLILTLEHIKSVMPSATHFRALNSDGVETLGTIYALRCSDDEEHWIVQPEDIVIENNRFRIRNIFTGENWNPGLEAPLSAPGIDVDEGDYLLAVNGTPVGSRCSCS